MVVRLLPSGVLDTSFDSDGIRILNLTENGGSSFAQDVAINAAQEIVVLGLSQSTPALARLTETGALDPTFAGDGILQRSFLGTQDVLGNVLIQEDGKILVTGWPINTFGFHIAIMRFTTAGELDTTWASPTGVATAMVAFTERIYSALLMPDEKVLVVGGLSITNTIAEFLMARFLNDGDEDAFETETSILSDTPDPSTKGGNVTVSYSVTATEGTPTGDVTLTDGAGSCTGTVVAGSCILQLPTASPLRRFRRPAEFRLSRCGSTTRERWRPNSAACPRAASGIFRGRVIALCPKASPWVPSTPALLLPPSAAHQEPPAMT